MTHHVANPRTGLRPMTYGRAMHMDLARASDVDLDRAFRVLNDYDDAGKASAYTQDDIDDRIDDINCEGDRRAGVAYAVVDRKPRSFWHPATEPVNAADADAQDDENPAELTNDGDAQEQAEIDADDEDAESPAFPSEDDDDAREILDAPIIGDDTDGIESPTEALREQAEAQAVDGLVPGETSSM